MEKEERVTPTLLSCVGVGVLSPPSPSLNPSGTHAYMAKGNPDESMVEVRLRMRIY